MPEDFVIKAQSRDETREATLTAYDFNRLCNNTTAEDYKQAQAESAPGSETPSEWNYVSDVYKRQLYMRVGDSMVEQPVPSFPKDAYQRIAEMIAIRKQIRKVLDLQVERCV